MLRLGLGLCLAPESVLLTESTPPGTGQWEGQAGLWSPDRSRDHQGWLSHISPYCPEQLNSHLSYVLYSCFLGPIDKGGWGNDSFSFDDLTLIACNQLSISKVTNLLKILGSPPLFSFLFFFFFFFPFSLGLHH